jgi:hypothetical protein
VIVNCSNLFFAASEDNKTDKTCTFSLLGQGCRGRESKSLKKKITLAAPIPATVSKLTIVIAIDITIIVIQNNTAAAFFLFFNNAVLVAIIV